LGATKPSLSTTSTQSHAEIERAHCRHPGFVSGLSFRAGCWALFFFGAIAAGSVLQWTVLGALLLTLLLVGSTVFTESIMKSKYPEYSDYQARTSPIVPWFARGGRTLRTEAVGQKQ